MLYILVLLSDHLELLLVTIHKSHPSNLLPLLLLPAVAPTAAATAPTAVAAARPTRPAGPATVAAVASSRGGVVDGARRGEEECSRPSHVTLVNQAQLGAVERDQCR